MSTPGAVAPCGRPRAGSCWLGARHAAPGGQPVEDTVPQGGSAHPSTASQMPSELIFVSHLTTGQRGLWLGGPLLGLLGLLLGEVHLLRAEEHLHQVIRLHPVLQGQTPAYSERPPDQALSSVQALLPGEQQVLPPWPPSSSASWQVLRQVRCCPTRRPSAGTIPHLGTAPQSPIYKYRRRAREDKDMGPEGVSVDTRPDVPLVSKPLAVRLGEGKAEAGPFEGQIPVPLRALTRSLCRASNVNHRAMAQR